MDQASLLAASVAGAAQAPPGLLEAVPDALVCVNAERRVLWRNEAARRMLGEEALPPGAPGEILAQLLEHLKLPRPGAKPGAGEPARLVETRSSPGRLSAWEVSWTHAVLGEGSVWLLSVREAPHYRQIQNALHKAQERQLIGALAGGIAHDFNNMLAAVIGNLDLVLTAETLSAEAREFVTRAQAGARRGAELTNRLLAFSRRADSQAGPLDLAKAVEEVMFILARSLSKAIQTRFTAPRDLWPAQADKSQIAQALMNLGLNARDAMPQGGTLQMDLANVTFEPGQTLPPRRAGDFVRVTVSDTGVGMEPEVLPRLFEPYFTTKAYGEGAGLGLSLVAHILAEQAGWIEVESRVSEGSRFHVFLPRAHPANTPALARCPECAGKKESFDGNETILVVDDEAPVRLLLRAVFQYRGYKVIEAASGEEALDHLQKAGSQVKLVLLDVDLPGLNGWETLARVRQLAPRLPVLLSSGGPTPDLEGELDRLGGTGFVEKPFRNEDLVRLVRQTLDQEKEDQAGARQPP
jgi:two-component system, cell cycle sensor histidine kinase and response regulator CckA